MKHFHYGFPDKQFFCKILLYLYTYVCRLKKKKKKLLENENMLVEIKSSIEGLENKAEVI